MIVLFKILLRIWMLRYGTRLGALKHPFPFDFLKRFGFSNRRLIAAYAEVVRGKDMAPVHDEYGCAEAVNTVVNNVLGRPVGGDVSTTRMFQSMSKDSLFTRVAIENALPGDIIISPTGYKRGRSTLANGHVGIVGKNGCILSNNSYTGLWDDKWTIDRWIEHYRTNGKYPIFVFRVLD